MLVSNRPPRGRRRGLRRPRDLAPMTLRRTLPLLACAVVLLAAPASAGAFQIGMQDDSAFIAAPPAAREKALDDAHAMGVTYLRLTMVWEGFRNEGWGPYDAAVNAARARGMTVQLTITGTPRFTAHGRGYIGYRNPKPGRFGTWAKAVARHFRGRIAYYSLWNEPNLNDFLAPQVIGHRAYGHKLYARLVRAGYTGVKRGDSRAKVLIGEAAPSGHPLRFIQRAAEALPGGLRADGWAQHPYQFLKIAPGRPQHRYTGGISNTRSMKALMSSLARHHKLRTAGGRPLPIFFTEFGYPRPGAYYGFFSDALRARYSLRAFQVAKRAGAKVLVWYQLYSARPTRPKLWDTGLIVDGQPTSTYRKLVGARASLAGF